MFLRQIGAFVLAACLVNTLLSSWMILSDDSSTADTTREGWFTVGPGGVVPRSLCAADLPEPGTPDVQPAMTEPAECGPGVGAAYKIVVTGSLVGHLRDAEPRVNLVYFFQLPYQSRIVSRDAEHVVELRRFGNVRMVKIASSAEDMRIRSRAPGECPLDALTARSKSPGIHIMSVARIADAILELGSESAVSHTNSRAYLEQDPLSGLSVRLVYRNGHVASLEPLDRAVSLPQAVSLFRQPLLTTPELVPATDGTDWKIDVLRLGAALDAAVGISSSYDLRVRSAPAPGLRSDRYEVLRPNYQRCVAGSETHAVSWAPEWITMGEFDVDRNDRLVTHASLEWSMSNLRQSKERLLFETRFRSPPKMIVEYYCQRELPGR